jgi:hypothetical protein
VVVVIVGGHRFFTCTVLLIEMFILNCNIGTVLVLVLVLELVVEGCLGWWVTGILSCHCDSVYHGASSLPGSLNLVVVTQFRHGYSILP